MAAERGLKGFSVLVREAIDLYLARDSARRELVEAALSTAGSLSDEEADSLEESVRQARRNWR